MKKFNDLKSHLLNLDNKNIQARWCSVTIRGVASSIYLGGGGADIHIFVFHNQFLLVCEHEYMNITPPYYPACYDHD